MFPSAGTRPGRKRLITEAQLLLHAVTTANVSTGKHGLTPVLPNDSTKFLNGVGAFAVPPGTGSGTVTNTGTLTTHALIKGNGGVDVSALGSLGTTTTLLHGNASGDPTYAAVDLTADVTGDLPYASFVPATAASLVVGRGSASGAGDWQEITLGANLTMSGTTLSASGGGANIYLSSPVTLAHANILTLSSVPVTILAGQGSGTAICPLAVHLAYNFTAGAYSNATGRIRFAGLATDVTITWSSVFNQTAKRMQNLTIVSAAFTNASIDNVALQLSTSADPTGGNAANTMTVEVVYTTLTLL